MDLGLPGKTNLFHALLQLFGLYELLYLCKGFPFVKYSQVIWVVSTAEDPKTPFAGCMSLWLWTTCLHLRSAWTLFLPIWSCHSQKTNHSRCLPSSFNQPFYTLLSRLAEGWESQPHYKITRKPSKARIPSFIPHWYSVIFWDSSVGRAEDWKSSCRWFNSVFGHAF